MNEIGKKLAARRKELGLTLEEVGRAVGVGKSTVQRWESGMIKNMGRDKIALLAKVLQISPIEIVPLDGVMPWDAAADFLDQTIVMMPNAEDQHLLEALHQDPKLRILFDRVMNMSNEDKEKMFQISGIIKGELYGDD